MKAPRRIPEAGPRQKPDPPSPVHTYSGAADSFRDSVACYFYLLSANLDSIGNFDTFSNRYRYHVICTVYDWRIWQPCLEFPDDGFAVPREGHDARPRPLDLEVAQERQDFGGVLLVGRHVLGAHLSLETDFKLLQ